MKRKKNSIIHSIRKQDGKAQKRDYRKKERKKERKKSEKVQAFDHYGKELT